MNRGGFSWKTLLGITAQKRKISKAMGVPFTKSARQRKAWAGGLWAALFTLFFD